MNGIFQTIKQVCFEPIKFFRKLKKEQGLKKAFTYYAVLFLFNVILATIITVLFQDVSSALIYRLLGLEFSPSEQTTGTLIFGLIFGYGIGLLASFVAAAVLHVWILLFGGQGVYAKTFQLYAYCKTPSLLLSWIPLASSLVWIYEMILLIIGTQITHGISKKKAIVMYIIPLIIVLVIYVLLFVFLITLFRNNPEILENINAF